MLGLAVKAEWASCCTKKLYIFFYLYQPVKYSFLWRELPPTAVRKKVLSSFTFDSSALLLVRCPDWPLIKPLHSILTLPETEHDCLSLSFSLTLSLPPSQECGQMEQTAQTSTPCAGHMTAPCWPLPMTLAKCTCSPSPALNQGSVVFTRGSTQHITVCLDVFETCPALRRRWPFPLPESSSRTGFLCQPCHQSVNERCENPMKAQQK